MNCAYTVQLNAIVTDFRGFRPQGNPKRLHSVTLNHGVLRIVPEEPLILDSYTAWITHTYKHPQAQTVIPKALNPKPQP